MLALVSFACGNSVRGNAPSPSGTVPRTKVGALTPMPREVATLIASPKTSFDVRFQWDQGISGIGPLPFEWRQGNGVRRRDVRLRNDLGSFLIERDFSDAVPLVVPSETIGCEWIRPNGDSDARVACDHNIPDFMGTLIDALDTAMQEGSVTRQVDGREIAGLPASCFEFTASTGGVICVGGTGIPLYFKGRFRASDYTQTIVATQVSQELQELAVPQDLPFSGAPFPLGSPFPVSRLQLPE